VKVLAVNWLDLENPQAGGAEIHFFEIFGRLADKGHQVTLVTSGWVGADVRASVRGIDVHRFGGRYSFALRGRGAVRRLLQTDGYDVLVEDINKLPLFLPTLSRLPFYALVPHLFGTTAFGEAAPPVAAVVWLAERPIPRIYRHAAFHAISESTREDLVLRGVARKNVRVIFPGVDTQWFAPDPAVRRAEIPTFLYVGRLKRYKGIDTVLRAVSQLRAEGRRVRLEITGKGDDLSRLERIAQELNLGDSVKFLGFVDEEEKRRLLRRAWSLVFPSVKEGWGISNVEAAACGTPAVASDSPGLRESVVDGTTGILVRHGDVSAMAGALSNLSQNPGLVTQLGQAGRRFAETLSWDHAAEQTEAHMLEAVRNDAPKGQKER
jgi:glycosyltransferase involved in cell wall biosynthesis